MKKSSLLLFGVFLIWSAPAQTFSVTFSVDMNNVSVDEGVGVHVAGNFQDWDPGATAMADDNMDGIYEVTVDVPDTLGIVEYKFINGDTWGFDEIAPAACAWNGGGNRYFELEGQTTLDTPCFGQCGACGTTTILFKVDMSQEGAINPLGVHMNGNFNGWDAANFLMMDDSNGDMIYTYVATVDGSMLDPVDTVLFKFVNGNTWGFDENPEGECSTQGNRYLSLTGGDLIYEASTNQAHCYNQCGSCIAPLGVTFRVDMSTQAAVSVNGVCVAGSFQGWTPGVDFLNDDDGDLVYEATIAVAPGDHEFKFINGNNWGGDGEGNIDNENPPGGCTTNGNRTFSISAEPIEVEYCYNQCSETCVADPDPAPIVFQVDMTNESVSENGVWLIGGMTSPQWQAGALQMTDADGDNIYNVTYEVSGAAFFEYRFCNGDPYPDGIQDDSVAEMGDFESGGCGQANPFGEFNRTHVRTGQPEQLGAYCYASCLDCNGDTISTGTGIEEIQGFIGIEAYPNPVEDILNIRFDGFDGPVEIQVLDLWGRVIVSNRSWVAPGLVSVFNTEAFRSGMYLLEVRSGLKRSTLRFAVK